MSKVIDAKIDWSLFDDDSESTIECRCGFIFRSHVKYIGNPINKVVSRKLCPGCSTNCNLRRVSSDLEVMTIKR